MLDWLTIDKTSGGIKDTVTTQAVNISALATTGRAKKSATIIITGNTDTDTFTKEVSITQAGKGLFVNVDVTEFEVSNEVQRIAITGTTNAKSIKLDNITEGIQVDNPQLYINGTDATHLVQEWPGSTGIINSDPGNESSFIFKIEFGLDTNPDTTTQRILQYNLRVSDGVDENAIQKTIQVIQGQNYYMNITPSILAFTAEGETKSLSIETNTTWTLNAS